MKILRVNKLLWHQWWKMEDIVQQKILMLCSTIQMQSDNCKSGGNWNWNRMEIYIYIQGKDQFIVDIVQQKYWCYTAPFKCSLIIVKKVVGIELVESDDIDLNRWIINKLFWDQWLKTVKILFEMILQVKPVGIALARVQRDEMWKSTRKRMLKDT